jgi:hypothetical protein
MPGNVAQELASLTVTDDSGRSIALGSLWADRPAIVVFVRQFG